MKTIYSKLFIVLTIGILTACNMPRTLGGATPIPTIDLPPTLISGPPPEPVDGIDLFIQEWHVATDGSDLNTCRAAPCATIGRALSLALSVSDPEGLNHHVIRIAAGTYTMDDSYYRHLEGQVTIIGAGADATIIDRTVDGEIGNGFPIDGGGNIRIEDLTLRNARDCIDIGETSSAEILINNVNLVDCVGNGVENRGTGLVELVNVHISGAHGTGFGPAESTWHEHGILNFGEMSVEGGESAGNDKTGVFNFGDISLIGTTLSLNQLEGLDHQMGTAQLDFVLVYQNGQGPAIRNGINTYSTLQIDNSRIQENGEGILVAPGGSLLMNDSIIRDHPGEALSIQTGTTAEIRHSLIENNASDNISAIRNEGELTLLHSDMLANHGNAIYGLGNSSIVTIEFSNITNTMFRASTSSHSSLPTIYMEDAGSLLNINNSLIAHNLLEGGMAAVESSGEAHILNSTISNNSGLGVYLWGNTSTISYSTIAENDSFGLLTSGINVDNSIIARNTPSDCINPLSLDDSTTSGFNIDTDGTCGVEQTHAPAAIFLGPLADNGGPTHTHALLPQSPAIDAATGACPPNDQRDFGRPVGAGCDVGAYETGASATTESEEEEEEDGSTTVVVIIPDTPCYVGPGPDWGLVNNMSAGTSMALVGAGFTGNGNDDWIVASHPNAANTNCWIPSEDIETSIPFSEMRLITVPGLPTPTPRPTSDRPAPEDTPIPCYYDQNQKLICP